jgi:hypothetical protein
MHLGPERSFIGLMDFFSILLPGALLTLLLMGEVGPAVLGDRYAQLAGAEAWAAFLFASYLFGHLVFLLAFRPNDFYDWPGILLSFRWAMKFCNPNQSQRS